jgi:MFS family permease
VSPGASDPSSGNSIDRATWIVAGVLIVGMVMSILDTTIVNVALDSLSRDLNAPLTTIQ